MNNSGQYIPPKKPEPKTFAAGGLILRGTHVLNPVSGAANAVKKNSNLGITAIGR